MEKLEAKAYYDADGDLWAIFTPGHVTELELYSATRRLFRRDSCAREAFEETNLPLSSAGCKQTYMRPLRNDPEQGIIYDWCTARAKTGKPVTAFIF